jgi:hypothetical protein
LLFESEWQIRKSENFFNDGGNEKFRNWADGTMKYCKITNITILRWCNPSPPHNIANVLCGIHYLQNITSLFLHRDHCNTLQSIKDYLIYPNNGMMILTKEVRLRSSASSLFPLLYINNKTEFILSWLSYNFIIYNFVMYNQYLLFTFVCIHIQFKRLWIVRVKQDLLWNATWSTFKN